MLARYAGTTVVAFDYESDGLLVEGYAANIMPLDFGERMTPEEIEEVILYIHGLSGEQSEAGE